jgi:hypothetical protein
MTTVIKRHQFKSSPFRQKGSQHIKRVAIILKSVQTEHLDGVALAPGLIGYPQPGVGQTQRLHLDLCIGFANGRPVTVPKWLLVCVTL